MKIDLNVKRNWVIADCAAFCRVREANGLLSNMANGLGFVDPETGIKWPSSEAWYQAQRFPDRPDIQEDIRNADNAFMAKKVAYGFIKLTRADWTDVNIGLMTRAIELKATNPLFVEALLATGTKPILELRNGEKFWGGSPSGAVAIGANVLGQLLVILRDKLVAAGQTAAPVARSFGAAMRGE